jgi:hypothetical protein
VDAEGQPVQLPCPTCRGPLVSIGSREIGSSEADFRHQHAYRCPAGCPGPEPDGTFEFIECPSCGSHDTSSTPRSDGLEEVECNACGTITSLHMISS